MMHLVIVYILWFAFPSCVSVIASALACVSGQLTHFRALQEIKFVAFAVTHYTFIDNEGLVFHVSSLLFVAVYTIAVASMRV